MTKETTNRTDYDTGMQNRLVSMICAIPLSSISDNLWSQRPPVERVIYPPTSSRSNSFWRQIPIATSILRMKKATLKAAQAKHEVVLRTKLIQRAAILFKHLSDPTRLQVVTLLSDRPDPGCDHRLRSLRPRPQNSEPGR